MKPVRLSFLFWSFCSCAHACCCGLPRSGFQHDAARAYTLRRDGHRYLPTQQCAGTAPPATMSKCRSFNSVGTTLDHLATSTDSFARCFGFLPLLCNVDVFRSCSRFHLPHAGLSVFQAGATEWRRGFQLHSSRCRGHVSPLIQVAQRAFAIVTTHVLPLLTMPTFALARMCLSVFGARSLVSSGLVDLFACSARVNA